MFPSCDRCDSPATFHLTEIKDGDKTERHLCEECAKVLQVPQANKELQNLLKSFDPMHAHVPGRREGGQVAKSCPDCGMTYAEFRQHGRFGCPKDYEVFQPEVEALLQRIHGASVYSGKSPDGGQVHEGQEVSPTAEVEALLQAAVTAEDYEAAARLRDELRRLRHEAGASGEAQQPPPGRSSGPGPGGASGSQEAR